MLQWKKPSEKSRRFILIFLVNVENMKKLSKMGTVSNVHILRTYVITIDVNEC